MRLVSDEKTIYIETTMRGRKIKRTKDKLAKHKNKRQARIYGMDKEDKDASKEI